MNYPKILYVIEYDSPTMSDENDFAVGFIGCGMMATALMEGLLSKGAVNDPSKITCFDIYKPSLEEAGTKGYNIVNSNGVVCRQSNDAIVIAVKPDSVEDACTEISRVNSESLIISIAAGVSLETLQGYLPQRRVVRVMPNTPCLIGEAASAFSLGDLCNDSDREIVLKIFGSVGIVKEVKEILLNAVTGLSGSGPAYVYQFIEALADGGVRSGLPRATAMELAAQTVKGAADMVLNGNQHPGQLKDNVTSPGGTTIAGVEALEKGGFRAATISAVTAATKRSMQLGGILEEEIRHVHNL